MPSIERVGLWIIAHWKSFGVGAIIIAIGRALMWLNQYRLARDQRRKLKQELEIQSFAEAILVWTDTQKVIHGTRNLTFPDDALRDLLRENADRLHIAMNYLEDKGLAKRAAPGYWSVRY